MISKNLFYNLMREDLKQKIWVIAVTILAFFFVLPVNMLILLTNENSFAFADQLQSTFYSGFLGNAGIFLVTVGIAFLVSMQGFCFLHSKKQVDFYHSIPVKREMLFAVKFINGILIYVIPFLVFFGITILIGLAKGISINAHGFLMEAVWMLITSILYYTLHYIVMIIGILLTGHMITSIFAIGTLLIYGPVCKYVFYILNDKFFVTSFLERSLSKFYFTQYLSPLTAYLGIFGRFDEMSFELNLLGCMITILVLLVVIALLVGIAVFLYRKRNSENAGTAIAFPKSEPVLKVCLIVLLSLSGGILMEEMVYNSGTISWYLFGVIITYLISSSVIEVIFAFDFKKIFANKKIWVINAGILFIINIFFIFDILGIDTYLPKEDQIASMSVNFSEMDRDLSRTTEEGYWQNMSELQLATMEFKDFKELYALSAESVAKIKQSNRIDLIETGGVPTNISENGQDSNLYMSVKYRLKNGREVLKGYRVDLLEEYERISKIYTDPQYLSATYNIPDDESYDKAYFKEYSDDYSEEIQIPLTTSGIQELSDIYEKEILGLTLECKKEMIPLGQIILKQSKGNADMRLVIYPFCTETMQVIEKATDGNLTLQKSIELDKIVSARVKFFETKASYSDSSFAQEEFEYESINIENSDANLQKVIDKCYLSKLQYTNGYWKFYMEPDIEVKLLYIMDDFGNKTEITYQFAKGEVPQFILEAQKEAKLKYEAEKLVLDD